MKTVADLQPGDIVNISDQPFTVKSVYTSGGSTTLVFEDVPATQERCDALKGLARDTGGIAGWADRVMAVGNILGKRVCEQVSNGGEIAIRGTDGTWYELDKAKLTAGIKQYIEESCHIRIEDERLVLDDLTTNEADVIVQFALFGETKF